ncbi:MAG TPA: hemin uptake protein HemP [Burkholderiaceae bacterium]|nr:hemin uptake protein HemP [Burkholderiaceae bacterium]
MSATDDRVLAAADAVGADAGAASGAASTAAAATSAGSVRVSSAQLFGASREVLIEHRGALYRLRKTSLGKLILTK